MIIRTIEFKYVQFIIVNCVQKFKFAEKNKNATSCGGKVGLKNAYRQLQHNNNSLVRIVNVFLRMWHCGICFFTFSLTQQAHVHRTPHEYERPRNFNSLTEKFKKVQSHPLGEFFTRGVDNCKIFKILDHSGRARWPTVTTPQLLRHVDFTPDQLSTFATIQLYIFPHCTMV